MPDLGGTMPGLRGAMPDLKALRARVSACEYPIFVSDLNGKMPD